MHPKPGYVPRWLTPCCKATPRHFDECDFVCSHCGQLWADSYLLVCKHFEGEATIVGERLPITYRSGVPIRRGPPAVPLDDIEQGTLWEG